VAHFVHPLWYIVAPALVIGIGAVAMCVLTVVEDLWLGPRARRLRQVRNRDPFSRLRTEWHPPTWELRRPAGGWIQRLFRRLTARVIGLLESSGSHLSAAGFLSISVALGVTSLLAGPCLDLPYRALPILAIPAAIPWLWLMWRRKRQLRAFEKQLPAALTTMIGAMQAGNSLQAAIGAVAESHADPIAREFGLVFEAMELGVPLRDSLVKLRRRMPNRELAFFSAALSIQQRLGGDLTLLLESLAVSLQSRISMQGRLKALTGEGRLSGIVLTALPFVCWLGVYQVVPNYALMLFEDEMGQKLLAGALMLQVVGAIAIHKIVRP
jgi:tight adherence protein B